MFLLVFSPLSLKGNFSKRKSLAFSLKTNAHKNLNGNPGNAKAYSSRARTFKLSKIVIFKIRKCRTYFSKKTSEFYSMNVIYKLPTSAVLKFMKDYPSFPVKAFI